MEKLEDRWRSGVGRRRALVQLATFLAGAPLLRAQQDPAPPLGDHQRFPGFDEMLTAFDFEPIFRANVSHRVYDSTSHGLESEFTLRRNREVFDWVDVVEPRDADVKTVSTATEILGMSLSSPLLVAPTGGQGSLHPTGEMGMHIGATEADAVMIAAELSSHPIDKIAAAADGPLWYQHYPIVHDARRREEALARAQGAGCQVVIVTIDSTVLQYERDLHDRNLGGYPRNVSGVQATARNPQGRIGFGGLPYGIANAVGWMDATWDYLDEIRPLVKVPMLVKGVLTAEDALLSVEHGMDGIVVSNHGGRVTDYAPSSLEVLPEVVDAVGDRVPVLIDSGFRRGEDVFKALALGARAVLLGRPTRWGLGAFGPPGVARLLEIIQAELVAVMKKTGRPTLDSIDHRAVGTRFS